MSNTEQIIKTEYADVMQKSYIDYAMSVIVSRALPDVRDGLKPVQRRTLYDMYELGIRYDRPYRKCARIVGDTMGKYHPHGDSSIYDALVVMAQDFKKAIALVDGHGNFGSIEGDGAAAMRYTEARLQKITQEVYLADMDKEVIDFVANFDETEKEPEVLPVRIPNLLVNGADGIAVGMATSIPPHNLGEVIDGVIAYMEDDEITVTGLMQYIKGPDFPTGGIIVNQSELPKIYETGSGKIRIRGKVETEKLKGGKTRLVITQIPYPMIGANIAKFLNDIFQLVETRKTTDIVDISNQSSKEGIRIVLELRKGADVQELTNLLYKKTRLEDTFSVNMLAVASGRPEILNLKQVIEHHCDFQFELTTRKYQNLLRKELEKKEIQEGLIAACDVIDLIIEILRGSKNQQQVKDCLTRGETEGIKFRRKTSQREAAKLRFTQRQATAILEMRLYRLIGLEIETLQKEHEETLKKIAFYEDVLNHYDSMSKVIIKDLKAIKKEFSTERKTQLEDAEIIVLKEPAPVEMEVCVLMDRFGYIRTVDKATYERNLENINKEYRDIILTTNTDKLCLFTREGKMHTVKVMDLPFGKIRDKGMPVDNYCNYKTSEEEMISLCSMSAIKEAHLLFVTKNGLLKQVEGAQFDVSNRTTVSTKLGDDDELVFVGRCDESEYVVLQTQAGVFLKFLKEEAPKQKKTARGVKGIMLADGDYVSQAYLVANRMDYAIRYHEKEVLLNKLKLGKHGTKGVKIRI